MKSVRRPTVCAPTPKTTWFRFWLPGGYVDIFNAATEEDARKRLPGVITTLISPDVFVCHSVGAVTSVERMEE
jgi:hypothetical protein